MFDTLSFFSGAMGLDLGLEAAGLSVLLSSDFDKNVKATMEANNRNYIYGDIREMILNDPKCNFVKNAIHNQNTLDDLFAIVGGPPCQPFSTAGARGGFDDIRGSLFKEFAHTIQTFKPKYFVMENVKGLLSSTTTDGEKSIDIIVNTFKEIGYYVDYELLNAVFYGVPQHRERLIIIGSRDHNNIFFPQPTHFKYHQSDSFRWRTIADVLHNLNPKDDAWSELPEKRLKFLPFIPEGGNWKDLSLDMQKEAMGGAFNSGGGKTGFFRRLSFSEPSPTLLTSPTQKSTMLLHPVENRPLSINEYKRIQQFPDKWIIKGNLASQYRQIGNAVPVGLGKAIGETLISMELGFFNSNSKRKTKPFSNPNHLSFS